jgi:hypothetical protein
MWLEEESEDLVCDVTSKLGMCNIVRLLSFLCYTSVRSSENNLKRSTWSALQCENKDDCNN